jgi:Domain of unknown function (DUF6970)
MKVCILAIISVLFLLSGCASSTQSANPAWVDELIQKFTSDPVANPPLSIWKYEYNGQAVYFVPAHCCDITSVLYNSEGTKLCAPDGGIAGRGDGKCSDFFDKRSNEQLIWQDNRTR